MVVMENHPAARPRSPRPDRVHGHRDDQVRQGARRAAPSFCEPHQRDDPPRQFPQLEPSLLGALLLTRLLPSRARELTGKGWRPAPSDHCHRRSRC